MNRIVSLPLVFVLFLAVPAMAADGLKIGWVDVQQVIISCKQGVEINKELEAKAQEYRKKFIAEKKKVDEMKKKLESLRTVGNDEAIQSQERAIDRKLQELKLDSKYASKDMKDMQKKFLGPVIDALNEVINEIGKKEGYDYILDSRTLLFAGDKTDITDAVIKAMNARYEAENEKK